MSQLILKLSQISCHELRIDKFFFKKLINIDHYYFIKCLCSQFLECNGNCVDFFEDFHEFFDGRITKFEMFGIL